MILSFLTFVFYLILGFWLFGLVVRLLLRFWLIRKQRQMQDMHSNQEGGAGPFQGGFFNFGPYTFSSSRSARKEHSQQKPEGEVTVEKTSDTSNASPVAKQVGDYVDFEEES